MSNTPLRPALSPSQHRPPHESWTSRAPRVPMPDAAAAPDTPPWKGVRWTLPFVGLLGYVLAVTTYRLPIGDVSMAAALVGLLLQGNKLRCPPVLIAFAVFIGWCAVTGILSINRDATFDRINVLVKLWAIGLVVVNAIRTPAQARFFNIFWLACFAFYPARGALFNFFIYGEKLLGRAHWNFIYENPNDLAAICILFFGLSLAVAGGERHKLTRMGAIAGLFVVPFVLLLTKSRGAFLGFALVALYLMGSGRKRLRSFGLTIVIASVVAIAAPSGTFDRVQGLSKLAEGANNLQQVDTEGSAEERYEIWRVARAIIAEHPIYGVGLGAYPYAHMVYANRFPDLSLGARGPRDTHSLYWNVAAETGIVGLFLLCTMYVLGLRSAFQTARALKEVDPTARWQLRTAALGVVGFLLAGVFGSMAYMSFLILTLMDVQAMRYVALSKTRAPVARGRAIAPSAAAATPVRSTPLYSPFGRF